MVGTPTLAMSYVDTDAAPHSRGAADSVLRITETASLVSTLLNPCGDGTGEPHPPTGDRVAQCVESFQSARRRVRDGDGPISVLTHDIDGLTAHLAVTTSKGPGANGG